MGSNLETMRSWIDAYNRGDVDAMLAGVDPEAEWVVAREHPESRTLHGLDEIATYHGDWLGTVEGLRFEVDELREVGDKVLARGRLRGTGRESGLEVEVTLATVTTFRNGVPVRTEEFLAQADAIRALEGRSG